MYFPSFLQFLFLLPLPVGNFDTFPRKKRRAIKRQTLQKDSQRDEILTLPQTWLLRNFWKTLTFDFLTQLQFWAIWQIWLLIDVAKQSTFPVRSIDFYFGVHDIPLYPSFWWWQLLCSIVFSSFLFWCPWYPNLSCNKEAMESWWAVVGAVGGKCEVITQPFCPSCPSHSL